MLKKNEEIKNTVIEEDSDKALNYCYYSRLLKKEFDSLEELKAAEAEVTKKAEAEYQAKQVKKERAEEIEKAYQEYLDVRKQAKEIIAEAQSKASELIKEAENKYYDLRNEFIKSYGSFHMSTYSDGKNEVVSISDLFDSIFKNFWF